MKYNSAVLGSLPTEGTEVIEFGLSELRLRDSWKRSIEEYRLDPSQPASPRIVSARECRHLRERSETFLRIAQVGVTRLHEQVRDSGYCVLLTNGHGITIDFRGHPTLDREYRGQGFRLGSCWSEEEEGTCGVGTAIVDRAPVLVHKQEHFRTQNNRITCSAVPILAPNDELLGILNASALSSPDDRRSQTLAYRLVCQNAAMIENALFFETYKSAWMMRLTSSVDAWGLEEGHLLAFDEDGGILGASRQLRLRVLERLPHGVQRIQDLFDLDCEQLRGLARQAPGLPIRVRCHANGTSFLAQLRAPARQATRLGNHNVGEVECQARPRDGFDQLAASDPRLLEIVQQIKHIADRRVPILLLGETGCGKEAFAKAIHNFSGRRDKPFVALNCAAIPESLIESELFGYREGAFTGARAKGCAGKVQLSGGGTLFLDEIGDMPLALQTRLLRVLAEGEVMALGASEPEKVDIHVVCATHRDLEKMITEGLFREDLFYRLNAAIFRLPPLRERSDVREVIRRIHADELLQARRNLCLPSEVEDFLCDFRWPGNIRELRNVLRFAIAVCDAPALSIANLPEYVRCQRGESPESEAFRPGAPTPQSSARSPSNERDLMVSALRRCGWHATAAALQIGMSRSTFYRRMKTYHIISPNLSDLSATGTNAE